MMNSIKTSFAFASALLLVSASLVCASTWSERTRITFLTSRSKSREWCSRRVLTRFRYYRDLLTGT